jgi:hypothetical protein
MLRMTRALFSTLCCDLFRQRGLVLDTINSIVGEQVLIFITRGLGWFTKALEGP